MHKGYRIISIEAADIYRSEQEYGVAVGYKMPEFKSDAYFRLFRNNLDCSLDLIVLEEAYKRICRKKFAFADEHIYDRIKDEKAERNQQVAKWLTNENVLILVLRHYEKNSMADWHIYASLINHPVFSELLFELYDRFIVKVVEDPNGEYFLYGRKFAKKF